MHPSDANAPPGDVGLAAATAATTAKWNSPAICRGSAAAAIAAELETVTNGRDRCGHGGDPRTLTFVTYLTAGPLDHCRGAMSVRRHRTVRAMCRHRTIGKHSLTGRTLKCLCACSQGVRAASIGRGGAV